LFTSLTVKAVISNPARRDKIDHLPKWGSVSWLLKKDPFNYRVGWSAGGEDLDAVADYSSSTEV
jgi:hypothetical protein